MTKRLSVLIVLTGLLYASCLRAEDAPMAGRTPPMGGGCPMMQSMMCPMMGMMQQKMAEKTDTVRIPCIGDTAPSFEAETTQGRINFPTDFKGKWVILFSHPADFTPVCTTEFMTFAKMTDEFAALNTQLIGLSIDSNNSHIAWLLTIRDKIKYKGMSNVSVNFPLIADIKMDVAKKFGMVHPAASDTRAVRAVFFIDPAGKIRALIYYPLSNGRNFQEIKRILIAMQTSDKYGVATPADWQPGDDVIVPPPNSCGQAAERVANAGSDYYCLDWFMCLKKLPLKELETGLGLSSTPKALKKK